MAAFIDIHHHAVYGLDDGPRDLRKAQQMVDAAYRDGVRIIFATPHMYPGRKKFDHANYRLRLNELNAYCAERNYDLKILPGAEVYYTDAALRLLQEGEIPTLNNTRFVLLEASTRLKSEDFIHAIREISNAGFTPVIAHIERYPNLWHKIKVIRQARSDFDFRIQVDAEVFLDKLPFFEKRFVKALIKYDLIDYVASDAHDTAERRVNMHRVYRVLCEDYGKKYARSLTGGNQEELLMQDE